LQFKELQLYKNHLSGIGTRNHLSGIGTRNHLSGIGTRNHISEHSATRNHLSGISNKGTTIETIGRNQNNQQYYPKE
jgi:hypothetical protein